LEHELGAAKEAREAATLLMESVWKEAAQTNMNAHAEPNEKATSQFQAEMAGASAKYSKMQYIVAKIRALGEMMQKSSKWIDESTAFPYLI
jgi:hypothetical protein